MVERPESVVIFLSGVSLADKRFLLGAPIKKKSTDVKGPKRFRTGFDSSRMEIKNKKEYSEFKGGEALFT